MKQAVSLIRALAMQGELILLDEPFSAAGIELKKLARLMKSLNSDIKIGFPFYINIILF